ncbi:MAG: ester cyclase [Pseudomonadota bacterium]|nr:ester cyclase [Pseudomonadota bacterium]
MTQHVRQPSLPNQAEANKAIVRRYIEEVINERHLDVTDELIAPTFNSLTAPAHGSEGIKESIGLFHIAFPDAQVTIEDLIAEGDKVAFRYTMRSMHHEDFEGIQATDQLVTQTGIGIAQIRDGKIAALWNNIAVLGLLR